MSFNIILPELLILITISLLLILGPTLQRFRILDKQYRSTIPLYWITLIGFIFALGSSCYNYIIMLNNNYFFDHFTLTPFISILKISIIIIGIGSLVSVKNQWHNESWLTYEFFIFINFIVFGTLCLISADDFLSFYISLEIQSISLYGLAGLKKNTLSAVEAILKYFILNIISSSIILFGIIYVYSNFALINFNLLRMLTITPNLAPTFNFSLIFGLCLIWLGLMFKLSAVPFHFWAPDVYEGMPLSIIFIFATLPKLGAIGIIIRLCYYTFYIFLPFWGYIFLICGILSVFIGLFGALYQIQLRRFIAYSAINNIGFILVSLAIGTLDGVTASLIYLLTYFVALIGLFFILLLLYKQNGVNIDLINDLSGLASREPLIAAILALLLFSFAGIPPLAGFFGKLFIIKSLLLSNYWIIAITLILTSIIASFYYIRIIVLLYFYKTPTIELTVNRLNSSILFFIFLLIIINLFLVLQPSIFIAWVTFFLI